MSASNRPANYMARSHRRRWHLPSAASEPHALRKLLVGFFLERLAQARSNDLQERRLPAWRIALWTQAVPVRTARESEGRRFMARGDERIGWPTLVGFGLVVIAFILLSLLVTATGTARFAVAMGYDANVGYAVGTTFDIAKGMLPVALLALLARRALGTAVILGTAWFCLVVFSCLATHATVSTAISAIERTGTWKMEVRGNTKAELTSVEQQLAALSRAATPRPAKTVREALAAERVPVSVWQDSQECGRIQDSAYFMRACAQVVQLRRELAASEDYERLSARAAELRRGLAEAPIVATSDPLPAAFNATLGRFVPIGGTEGVALLLTVVVELMSSFGLVGLSKLCQERQRSGRPTKGSLVVAGDNAGEGGRAPVPATQQSVPLAEVVTLPQPSLSAAASGRARPRAYRSREAANPPSNVVPMTPRSPPRALSEGASPRRQCGRSGALPETQSHVPAFIQQRLHSAKGTSVAARELRAVYEAWCGAHGHGPLSQPKLAAELKALGYNKWKSCGLIRYRNLQLVA